MITWQKVKNALCAILGLLVGFLLFWRKSEPENTKEAKKVLDESKKTAGEIVKNKKEREREAADLKEKLKKITTGTLILVFLFCVPVMAAEDIEIHIPDDYEKLVEYYKATVEVALEYQRLYEAAEADVDRLLEENRKLSEQLEIMIQYNRQRRLGLTAGALISPYPGIFVGLTLQL